MTTLIRIQRQSLGFFMTRDTGSPSESQSHAPQKDFHLLYGRGKMGKWRETLKATSTANANFSAIIILVAKAYGRNTATVHTYRGASDTALTSWQISL